MEEQILSVVSQVRLSVSQCLSRKMCGKPNLSPHLERDKLGRRGERRIRNEDM